MLNIIVIHGRLTKEPELRMTQGGTPVASFTVAVDRDYKAEDGKRETDFVDCVAWRKGAEHIANHYRKGSEILLTGRLQSRDWTDKQGNKRKAWEIVVERTDFCGSRQDGGRDATSSGAYAPPSPQGEGFAGGFAELTDDDGDLPF